MSLIDVSTTATRMTDEGVVLLDVREDHEWAAAHVDGAVHMPLSRFDLASLDADTTYLTMCRSGGRSAQAAEALGARGFTIEDVDGGMLAWAAAGLPMVSDTDAAPQVIAP